MKIEVDGVELTVTQQGDSVSINRVVGRDRLRDIDIRSGLNFGLRDHKGEEALQLLHNLKKVAKYKTAPCTCDYRYGWSGHADHCKSIYVAKYDGGGFDDD